MKCNFKNKFLHQKESQINLINSFKKNVLGQNYSSILSKEEKEKLLMDFLKSQSYLAD